MESILENLGAWLETLPEVGRGGGVLRYVVPLLAILIVARCAVSLLTFRREAEVWAWLTTQAGDRIPVTHWENLLGRGRGSDVLLEYPTISRTHAVLTRYDDGSWSIFDCRSKSGTELNGEPVEFAEVKFGDVLSLGGVQFTLVPITAEQEKIQAEARRRGGVGVTPSVTLLLLTVFQLLVTFLAVMGCGRKPEVLLSFLGLMLVEWALFFGLKLMRRRGFDVETIAFFLTTMGFAVVATSAPESLLKEFLALCAGLVVFLFVGWTLRDLERAKVFRYLASAAGILLLAVNLVLGTEKFGARNWIQLGGMSFQPSELVKICFVYAGASTLHRLMAKRNLILFIGYSAAICGCLALMNDFGTAIIFFVAFLVIAFLRSGDVATIALACAGTGFAGVLALRFKPYALKRFSAWGHVWENALTTGYSQTRAMMCIASGGLFGLGAGKGWLHNVGAADTDLVFALVSEEWGLILAVTLVAAIAVLAVFVVRSAPVGRCVRGGDDPRDAGDFERVRHGGHPAADRRDVPVRVERRIEHAVRLGPAGVRQGRGHAAERELRHSSAGQKGGLTDEKGIRAGNFPADPGDRPPRGDGAALRALFCEGGRVGHVFGQPARLHGRESRRRRRDRPGRHAAARQHGRADLFRRRCDAHGDDAPAGRPVWLHSGTTARQLCGRHDRL